MALNSGVLAEKRRIRMDKPEKKEGYGQKKAPHREPIRRGNHEIIMVPLLGGKAAPKAWRITLCIVQPLEKKYKQRMNTLKSGKSRL
jgi:hypothetical protein